jgi:hypothetical protein
MPQNFEQKIPNNGMNRDDEARLLGEGESRLIVNLRSGSSEGDNIGALENIKGTTEVNFDLPTGYNKCIGSYGDQTTHTNFFFIYNSLGNHTIYRYIPENRSVRILVQETILNFGEFDFINDIDVIDNLLYWNDEGRNPPRKINFDKADVDDPDFRQVFHWYLGDKYLEDNPSTLDVKISIGQKRYDTPFFDGNFTVNVNQALIEEKDELAQDIASQLNAITVIGTAPITWEAEACGDFVSITITNSYYYRLQAISGLDILPQIVPQNHYQFYIDRTIDVIKYPPHCDIKALIKSNETFERNFIKEKVFQFAARYIYDDNEKSTVNPYSVSIYNKYTCSQFTGDNISNYIELDLSIFPEIFNVEDLQTIKRIELFVKEGQLGLWKSITTLEQYEFVDIADTHFDFYNNFRYSEANPETFPTPFYNVPILTKNQESVKNRVFYGNNLEGYDRLCVNAAIDVEYDDVESRVKPPTYSVSGMLLIRAMFNGGRLGTTGGGSNARQRKHAEFQPIRKDGQDPQLGNVTSGGTADALTVWGGMSEGAGNDPEVFSMAIKTGQILPLDGFTVYLAATDFYAISTQNIGDGDSNVSQNAKGVWQNSGNSDMYALTDRIRDNIQEGNGVGTTAAESAELNSFGEVDGTKVYSRFSIDNVPDGWYTLRVASHLTNQEDLDSPDRTYQKTSANVYQITNLDAEANPASVGNRESAIRGRSELLINVRGGNLPRIKVEVMDMSHASDRGSSKIATGYVCDNDGQNPTATYSNILSDTRVARAAVGFDINPGDVNYNIFTTNARCDGRNAITDHNGYFYYASIEGASLFNPNGSKLSFCNLRSADAPSADYGLQYIAEQFGQSTSNKGENSFMSVAIRVNPNTTSANRVIVKGSIRDNTGIGIPKASLVAIRSAVVNCDLNGDYLFYHYGIRITSAGNPSLDTYLIPVRTSRTCSAFFEENQIYDFGFNYNDWYNGNQAAPNQVSPGLSTPLELEIPFFLGDVSNLVTLNTMKRGWDGQFGLIYYDRGLRDNTVNSIEDLELHIPFYTEKDIDGQQKVGIPIINWEIKHRPPVWATHYQWARTRNNTTGSYFQWITDEVQYADAKTPYNPLPFNQAERIRISIGNIVRYKEQFPTLDLEANPDNVTWRIRFIKDVNGNYFSDYIDLKILEVDSDVLVVENTLELGEIFPGTLMEIYNESLEIEGKLFYEFGECFEIGTYDNGNRYHKGLTQDQDPINPITTPAKGTFRTGDAYYRLRGVPDVPSNTPAYIDDDGVSDFYKSEVESIGRPNGINPDYSQKWKPSQIRHGGKYVPDSNINNISNFFSSDFQPLPISYGAIHKLQVASNVLLSIHEFRWVSNYIEEGIMRKQDGNSELVASTKVFDSFRAAKARAGTINQESVSEYKGNVYAWDMNKGAINKYGADGVSEASNYKMFDYFSDKAKLILNKMSQGTTPMKVIGVFDPKHDEYIVSFSELRTSPITENPGDGGVRNTVSFEINDASIISAATDETLYSVIAEKDSGSNILFDVSETPDLTEVQVDNQEGSKGILRVKIKDESGSIKEIARLEPGQGIAGLDASGQDIVPKPRSTDRAPSTSPQGELLVKGETLAFSEKFNKWTTFYSFRPEMFGIIDLEMIGFTEGKLWIHNDNETRNNFYGVQYTSILETVFNTMPSKVKVFDAISAESYHAWSVPSAKTPNGMETEVIAQRFVKKEDGYYAPMMRNKNDPRFATPIEAIINGAKLRDRTAQVTFENADTNEVVLFSVSMIATISERHNK